MNKTLLLLRRRLSEGDFGSAVELARVATMGATEKIRETRRNERWARTVASEGRRG